MKDSAIDGDKKIDTPAITDAASFQRFFFRNPFIRVTSRRGLLAVKLIVCVSVFLASREALHAHWKIPSEIRSWKYLDTPHFKIHYQEGYEEMALRSSVVAEESAARYERVLRHRLTRVVPVFLFASHQDFSATNILPYEIDEGTGGFTDFYRQRVVVPFTGDYALFRHVLAHEIAHAFQFDIISGSEAGAYPLWLMEGMAEYLSLGWDESAETYIRDAVLYDILPDVYSLQAGRVSNGYMYYKAGQAVMLFIASEYGEERIGFLLKELKGSQLQMEKAIESTFRMNAMDFNTAFGRFIRARYAAAARSMPVRDDLRVRPVTNRYEERGFNLHPVLSPDGKNIAYMTAVGIFPAIVIRRLPGPGVSREKAEEVKIVVRALRSEDYEEYQPLTTRLSFSPDGKKIILAGRRSGRQALLIIGLEEKEVTGDFSPPFDAIQYPAMSPDGKKIVFTGVLRGSSDLYILDTTDGSLERQTNDACYETGPSFSPDMRLLYYSSNCVVDPQRQYDAPAREIYRLEISSGVKTRLTELGVNSDSPMPAGDGSLVFRSNFTGVSNLYRIPEAASRAAPARASDIAALTRSQSGVSFPSLVIIESGSVRRETAAFVEIAEGAREIRVISASDAQASYLPLASVPILPEEGRTFNPVSFRFPSAGEPVHTPLTIEHFGNDYRPVLNFIGNPFIMITGGSNSSGGAGFAAIAAATLQDDTGDHVLGGWVSYFNAHSSQDELSRIPVNANLEYAYLKYRPDFFAGVYRQSGVYAILNIFDYSLNNLLYNPYFRLISRNSAGIYGGVDYPLHRYGAIQIGYEQGREERIYRQTTPEERRQPDVFDNYQAMTFSYRFDNVAYSIFGPLDGHSVYLGYSVPLRMTATERELYVLTSEYRYYHLFDNFWNIAFRAFAGASTGADAFKYPFRLGGFGTLRGYDFQEFEGTKAFMINAEMRFNLVEHMQFAFPFHWSPGLIRGAFFVDAGSAFDDYHLYQAVDGRYGNGCWIGGTLRVGCGVTRDLHMSIGVGIHWVLFYGFLAKIEWASPYDFRHSLPLSKWRGQFSLGVNF